MLTLRLAVDESCYATVKNMAVEVFLHRPPLRNRQRFSPEKTVIYGVLESAKNPAPRPWPGPEGGPGGRELGTGRRGEGALLLLLGAPCLHRPKAGKASEAMVEAPPIAVHGHGWEHS